MAGYDGVPGALAEESTTEDVAVVALLIAGVSNLSNSDEITSEAYLLLKNPETRPL